MNEKSLFNLSTKILKSIEKYQEKTINKPAPIKFRRSEYYKLVRLLDNSFVTYNSALDKNLKCRTTYKNNIIMPQIVRMERYIRDLIPPEQEEIKTTLTAKDIFLDLKSLSQCDIFEKVTLNNNWIKCTTKPITLEDVKLGRFDIVWTIPDYIKNTFDTQFKAIALEPNPANGGESITHPHVCTNIICFGTKGYDIVSKCLESGRIEDAFISINTLLHTYNPESPHAELEYWDNLDCCPNCGYDDYYQEDHFGCYSCDKTICPACNYCCSDCDMYVCGDCINECNSCEKTICSGCCEDKCSLCSNTEMCEECYIQCTMCDKFVCKNCADYCYGCNYDVCTQCSTKCNDCLGMLCNDCISENNLCKQCEKTATTN